MELGELFFHRGLQYCNIPVSRVHMAQLLQGLLIPFLLAQHFPYLVIGSVHQIMNLFVRGVIEQNLFGDGKCLFEFIKICQNTPQLCWGDEWLPLSPGGRGEG